MALQVIRTADEPIPADVICRPEMFGRVRLEAGIGWKFFRFTEKEIHAFVQGELPEGDLITVQNSSKLIAVTERQYRIWKTYFLMKKMVEIKKGA